MLVSFQTVQIGESFSSQQDDLYREFTKTNSVAAIDNEGCEWLFMDLVEPLYSILEH